MATKGNLEMHVGNQRRFKATATWPRAVPELSVAAGDAYNLSTATKVWFTAKTDKTQADSEAAILKDTSRTALDDITFVGNVAYFDIHETDTAQFEGSSRATKLYYDLQVLAATGETWTVAEGELMLYPRVTKANV